MGVCLAPPPKFVAELRVDGIQRFTVGTFQMEMPANLPTWHTGP